MMLTYNDLTFGIRNYPDRLHVEIQQFHRQHSRLIEQWCTLLMQANGSENILSITLDYVDNKQQKPIIFLAVFYHIVLTQGGAFFTNSMSLFTTVEQGRRLVTAVILRRKQRRAD